MGCVDCGGDNNWDNCDALAIKNIALEILRRTANDPADCRRALLKDS
jgi:hypothetical protein